ncbi:hypothetical protein [Pandoraea pnomenusa]|uniref:hypothetical protein n=1 Tax=Pandoraea pnomenusa TaxID=93220 RepID=UPI001AC12DFF|nr:hypothetical protein [Pandoraea pnomenusa]MBN9093894.1 hypothetical protein [Pandoraea pnomenusa]
MNDDDISKRRQEALQGARVAALIRDEVVTVVFADIESAAVKRWAESRSAQEASDSGAWHQLKAIRDFRDRLETIVQTGKMAETQLQTARSKHGQKA